MRTAGQIILYLLFSFLAAAQQIDIRPVCEKDTIEVRHRDLKYGGEIRYRAIRCSQPSRLAARFELGATGFRYEKNTKTWLGNHGSGLLGFGLAYQNWTFALRMKFWTVRPARALLVDGDSLTSAARLNPVKFDYLLGYSFNLKRQFSIEPYIGYARHRFFVINEEELQKDLDLRTGRGFLAGATFNKYFQTKHYHFIAVFLSFGYASTDLSRVHPSLGKGYAEASAGIAFKGFGRKEFLRPVARRSSQIRG
jgi:hypothetical protein